MSAKPADVSSAAFGFRPDRLDLALFLGALIVRLAYVLEIRTGPVFRYLLIDSEFYDAFGRRLAMGDGLADGPFFMNVLYGLFLGGTYSVFGAQDGGRLATLLLQAALGAAAVPLLRRLGIALGRERAGRLAAIALAGFGPAIFYDGALLTPSLLLLLTLLSTLVAVPVLSGEPRPRAAAVLGLITGLLVLGRANHVLLLVLWTALLLRGGRRAFVSAAVLVVAAILVVAPVTIRNARQTGEFIPVTANGGMALWAGNWEGAMGIYAQPPFLQNPVPDREAEDYRLEASRRAGQDLTLAESSRFWTAETRRRWAAEPGAMLRLAARKVRLFFHATESQTNLSYYFALDQSRVLSVFRLHFGWFLPLMIVGLIADGRRQLVALAPVAVSLVTCALFYMSSEYRHPVAPLMLFFAALGLERVIGWMHPPTPWGRRAAVAVAGLVLLVSVNYRDPFLARLQSRRVDYYNFGSLASMAGDLSQAEGLLRRSIAIDPKWGPSRAKLADVLQRMGRVDEAGQEGLVAAGLGRDPSGGVPDGAMRAAHEAFAAERFEEALERFLGVARDDGVAKPNALNNAGLCAMQLGLVDRAGTLFTEARAADPTYASPVIHLGRMALALGDSARAAAYAEEALRIAPDDERAQRLRLRASGE